MQNSFARKTTGILLSALMAFSPMATSVSTYAAADDTSIPTESVIEPESAVSEAPGEDTSQEEPSAVDSKAEAVEETTTAEVEESASNAEAEETAKEEKAAVEEKEEEKQEENKEAAKQVAEEQETSSGSEQAAETPAQKDRVISLAKSEHGSVSFANMKEEERQLSVKAGTKVSLTIKPESGYELSKINIKATKDGADLATSDVKSDRFEFEMVDEDITILVNFVKSETKVQEEKKEEKKEEVKVDSMAIMKDAKKSTTSDQLKSIDFSSKRLILGTEKKDVVIDPEHILSEYDGIYLLQYDTIDDAKLAYSYYFGRADFVDADITVRVADNENPTGNAAMTENANPISELESAVEDAVTVRAKNVIALIDSGASSNEAIVERVSMLGDDAGDNNGHGDRMVSHILAENPDAKIISIKALDGDGKGNISSVYAAIQYAIEQKVDIINLSLYAYSTSSNAAIADAIKQAVNSGITVVGAAGNDGRNVKYYVPGKISEAMIVGAANEDGTRRDGSNYGDTVDYNVVGESTSESTARMSAYLAAHEKNIEASDINAGLIFETNYTPVETPAEESKEADINSDDVVVIENAEVYDQGLEKKSLDIVLKRAEDETQEEFDQKVKAFKDLFSKEPDIFYDEEDRDDLFRAADEKALLQQPDVGHKLVVIYNNGAQGAMYEVVVNGVHLICTCADPLISNPPLGHTYTAQDISSARVKKFMFFTYGAPGWSHYKIKIDGKEQTMKQYWNETVVPHKPNDETIRWNGYAFNHYYLAKVLDDDTRNKAWNYRIDGTDFEKYILKAYNAVDAADTPPGVSNLEAFIIDTGNHDEQRMVYCRGALIRMKKTDADTGRALADAEFTFTEKGASKGKTLVTGENGYTDWFCVPTDSPYTVKETEAPEGYKLNTKVFSFKGLDNGETDERECTNEPEPESVYLKIVKKPVKKAEWTLKHTGDYSLEGAKFAVYSKNNDGSLSGKLGTLTTDNQADGQATTDALEISMDGADEKTVYVKETVAPKGYVKNDEIFSVKLVAGKNTSAKKAKQLVVEDGTTKPVYAYILKESTVPAETKGNNCYDLQGAQFTIYEDSACTKALKTLTTGEENNGVAKTNYFETTLENEESKTFYIRETNPPKGYREDRTLKKITVTVDNDSKEKAAHITVKEEPHSDPLGFRVKKIEDGKLTSALQGAKFTIKYYDGFYNNISALPSTAKKQWTVTTDKNGYADGPEELFLGTYVIDEIGATYGYNKDTATVTVSGKKATLPLIGQVTERDRITIGNELTVSNKPINIFTEAKDDQTESQFVRAGDKITIRDDITYENLTKGKKYRFKGKLVDASNTKKVIAEGTTDLTATEANGNAKVYFKDVDLTKFAGKDLVVFEYLYEIGSGNKEEKRADHVDEKDPKQTLHVSEIKTVARDSKTGEHVTKAEEDAKVIDKVILKNFTEGTTYKIKGRLMRITEEGAEVLTDADGKEVTAEKTFEFNDENVSTDFDTGERYVELEFDFNASGLEDTKVVAYEQAYMIVDEKEVFVANHEDPNDTDQTDYIPKIDTTVSDVKTEMNHTLAEGTATVTDRVDFSNVKTDLEYDLYGTLMDKSTNAELTWTDADGNSVTPKLIAATYNGQDVFVEGTVTGEGATTTKTEKAHAHFKPTESVGYVLMTFEFDAKAVEGTTAVVFEDMYHEDKEVAVHADLEAYPQTQFIPKVRTTVKSQDTETNVSNNNDLVRVTDTVLYNGLDVGRTYYIEGDLHKQVISTDEEGNETVTDGGVVPSQMYILNDSGEEQEVARTEFIPAEKDGSVDIYFKIDASYLEGGSVVAFERLYTDKNREDPESDDVLVGRHEDITDESQTLHFPKIRTTAVDDSTSIHMGKAGDVITVYDDVQYENLVPGKEYTISGRLMKKLGTKSDKTITVTEEKPSEDTSGETEGSTTADTDEQNADAAEVSAAGETQTSEETKNEGSVIEVTKTEKSVEVSDAEELLIGGKPVTASRKFTPSSANGTIRIKFAFDGSELESTDVVAFEVLTIANPDGEDIPVAEHEDPDDPKQTVVYPKVRTVAEDGVTVTHVADSGMNVLTDHIDYENVEIGREYVIRGTLHDKADGSLIKSTMIDGNGDTIDGVRFTAKERSGRIDLRFRYDATKLMGHSIVVYETLSSIINEDDLESVPKDNDGNPAVNVGDEVVVGEHADLTDANQTIVIPEISTTAVDTKTGGHETQQNPKTSITDRVFFKNLLPGMTYELTGTLYSKKTSKPVMDADGNTITKTVQFEADTADGYKDITFTLDTSAMIGDTLVAFEKLKLVHDDPNGNGKTTTEVARHEDINDADQSVKVVNIRTTLLDYSTTTHESGASKEAVLFDRVYFKNLTIGQTYYLYGTLYDKATKKPLKVNKKNVTAKGKFKATVENGYVDLKFKFDSSALAGHTVVAFEDLYTDINGVETIIAIHHDINDEDQSVNVVRITTKLKDAKTGKKSATLGKEVTLTDTVTCEGLIVGQKYTIKGTLMDKATGKSTGIEAKPVTFKAEKSTQKVDINFKVNTEKYAGKSLVAYEKLYAANGNLITSHEDIKDKDQTIDVPKVPGEVKRNISNPGTPGKVQTGDASPIVALSIILAIAGIALVIVMNKKRRLG